MEEDYKKKVKNLNAEPDSTLKHLEYSDSEDESQEQYEQQEYKNKKTIEMDTYNNDILTNVRLEMITYCDDMSLPLCDYLTHDAIHEFIDFLTSPSE